MITLLSSPKLSGLETKCRLSREDQRERRWCCSNIEKLRRFFGEFEFYLRREKKQWEMKDSPPWRDKMWIQGTFHRSLHTLSYMTRSEVPLPTSLWSPSHTWHCTLCGHRELASFSTPAEPHTELRLIGRPLQPTIFMSALEIWPYVRTLVIQSCLTLCDPMDCSPPGSSVHGLLQVRILEWAALPSPGDLLGPGIELRSPAL